MPSGPESLKPAGQNGGASACCRGVGWGPAPASGLEVCRYFESVAVSPLLPFFWQHERASGFIFLHEYNASYSSLDSAYVDDTFDKQVSQG